MNHALAVLTARGTCLWPRMMSSWEIPLLWSMNASSAAFNATRSIQTTAFEGLNYDFSPGYEYAQRTETFFIPPTSGNYTFVLNGDDNTQLNITYFNVTPAAAPPCYHQLMLCIHHQPPGGNHTARILRTDLFPGSLAVAAGWLQ
jgi:hypothetical protein